MFVYSIASVLKSSHSEWADGQQDLDPAFRNARREAIVLVVIFAISLTYSVLVSYFLGYDRNPSEIVTYLGIPDWVLWGVFLPWTVCVLVTVWFTFFFMVDDPLEEPASDPPEEDASDAA